MSVVEQIPTILIGDVGTVFRVKIVERVLVAGCWTDVAVDVSAFDSLEILFKLPDGSVRIRGATFTTDGTDGLIQYTTIETDIDQAGGIDRPWAFSGFVEDTGPPLRRFSSLPSSFVVEYGIDRPASLLTPKPVVVVLSAPAVTVVIA